MRKPACDTSHPAETYANYMSWSCCHFRKASPVTSHSANVPSTISSAKLPPIRKDAVHVLTTSCFPNVFHMVSFYGPDLYIFHLKFKFHKKTNLSSAYLIPNWGGPHKYPWIFDNKSILEIEFTFKGFTQRLFMLKLIESHLCDFPFKFSSSLETTLKCNLYN